MYRHIDRLAIPHSHTAHGMSGKRTKVNTLERSHGHIAFGIQCVNAALVCAGISFVLCETQET